MRVAMIAPIAWRTPPRHYGPWELVTSLLTEALVARGVDVTLFATLDSLTAAKLAGVPMPAEAPAEARQDAEVVDLVAALKASVEAAKKRREEAAAASPKKKAKAG